MKFLKSISALILVATIAIIAFASTYAPVYPFIQKTENGKVKSHAFPYGGYDGPYGPGETFVYANEKLLYSIDEYLISPFFTLNNGQYLIEFNFVLAYIEPFSLIDDDGKVTVSAVKFDGDAVRIFKDGKLLKSIDFTELNVDSSKIEIAKHGNRFAWNYNVPDNTKDKLKVKMKKYPAYIEGSTLNLITADNQLISIDIASGKITDSQNAYETLKVKSNWKPTTITRKNIKVDYPEKFLLPKLENEQALEQGLAAFLNKEITDRKSAEIKIYIHTLLINKSGKCEYLSCSPDIRQDTVNDNFIYSAELTTKIENWIMQQTFKTDDFPKDFQKFKYTDFIYLK